jgi:CDP-glucose 4,6-dehydratase
MHTDFWRNKRVLITGHTGFKGSWLCLWLNSVGADVTGYALKPPSDPSLYELARVDETVRSTLGDIRDLDHFQRALEAAAPEVIFHMAAQSVVLSSYGAPVDTYSTNVMGTVHVLEALRRAGARSTVVNVTTDKVYENKDWVWGYRENDRLGGHDPYSNSKACAELVAQAYRDSFFPPTDFARHGVGLASARAGNVIGGGDWTPHQLIPAAVAALQRGESVVLRHPEATRPWQHVLDCLDGYITLAQALARDPGGFSGEWNFGPADGDSRPVSYIVETLAKHWGVAVPWVQDGQVHATEATELRLETRKAASVLGWRASWSLDTALDMVARWYDGHHTGSPARGLCLEQIQRYTDCRSSLSPSA